MNGASDSNYFYFSPFSLAESSTERVDLSHDILSVIDRPSCEVDIKTYPWFQPLSSSGATDALTGYEPVDAELSRYCSLFNADDVDQPIDTTLVLPPALQGVSSSSDSLPMRQPSNPVESSYWRNLNDVLLVNSTSNAAEPSTLYAPTWLEHSASAEGSSSINDSIAGSSYDLYEIESAPSLSDSPATSNGSMAPRTPANDRSGPSIANVSLPFRDIKGKGRATSFDEDRDSHSPTIGSTFVSSPQPTTVPAENQKSRASQDPTSAPTAFKKKVKRSSRCKASASLAPPNISPDAAPSETVIYLTVRDTPKRVKSSRTRVLRIAATPPGSEGPTLCSQKVGEQGRCKFRTGLAYGQSLGVCGEELVDDRELVQSHLAVHYEEHGWYQFRDLDVNCCWCGQKRIRFSNLTRHILDHHLQLGSGRCPCGGSFSRGQQESNRLRHLSSQKHRRWAEEREKYLSGLINEKHLGWVQDSAPEVVVDDEGERIELPRVEESQKFVEGSSSAKKRRDRGEDEVREWCESNGSRPQTKRRRLL